MNLNTNPPSMMAWLRLLRIPNLPSAISNILMAYLLVHQSWAPTLELALLIVASCSLYLSGMVLNDVFDFEIDKLERPGRPLPANQISRRSARNCGFGLLVFGVTVAVAAGWIANSNMPLDWQGPFFRTGLISIALAATIFLYDGPLKRTVCAPVLMGGCRTLNILLGASTFSAATAVASEPASNDLVFGLPIIVWWVAIAIGIIVTGTTLLGRNEASEQQQRIPLLFAGILILAGLVTFAMTAYCPSVAGFTTQQKQIFPLFIAVISLTIARRVIEAIISAKPQQIQRGVISVLRSLIIFDASICYLAAPDQLFYGVAVLALLVPTLLMARFVPST